MSTVAVAALVKDLRQHALLEPAQLEAVRTTLQAAFNDPAALAADLVRRGWLTPYQADLLSRGRAEELVLGSYLLLGPLGEGGMGQVFKARQRKLGRIDAVKVVRAERVANPETLSRFQREMRAAATLSHPNVVQAYYADEDRGRHYFAMELLAGSDLARLVADKGPLAFGPACDYVRQAALGLQHAHERGLVHRDVKPSNLIVTPGGEVKVLDLGLARVEQQPGSTEGELTGTGAVMGTPDYIAPEQARQSRTADARADLYSLGCTLYFLLTGRPPFPDRPMAAKVAAHLFEQPEPVEKLRPGTPPALAAVVRRLMAKKPEERFQSAAELAAVLARIGKGLEDSAEASTGAWSDGVPATEPSAATTPTAGGLPRRRGGRAWLYAASGLLLIGAFGGLAWAFWRGPLAGPGPAAPLPASQGTLLFQADDDFLRLLVHAKDKPEDTREVKPGEPLALAPGDYELQLAPEGATGLRLSAREASLAAGGQAAVRVEGQPISPFALVSRPATIDGVQSWTIVTRTGRGGVNHLAYSPDGKWLAAAYEDNVVRLLTATGEFTRAFVIRADRVHALAWSPDKSNPVLAVADSGVVHLWSAAGRLVRDLPGGAHALAWSSDGRTLACAASSEVEFWDPETGEHSRPPLLQDGPVHCLAWSRDGVMATGGEDGIVRLWRGPEWKEEVHHGHEGLVVALAWSPDSSMLVSAGKDGMIRRWPAAPGADPPSPIKAGKGPLTAVAWITDRTGLKIVSSSDLSQGLDTPLSFWNPVGGEQVRSLALNAGPMLAIVESPNDRTLACGGFEQGIHFWDLKMDRARGIVAGQQGDFAAEAVWSHDGKHIATDGWVQCILLWAADSGELQRRSPVTPEDRTKGTCCGAGSSKHVFYVCGDQAHIWSTSADKVATFPMVEGKPLLMAHPRENGALAIAYDDRRIRIWDPPVMRVLKTTLDATRNPITALLWTPDGKGLAAGDDGGGVYLWEDVASRRPHECTHPGKVLSLAWSPDGQKLAAAGADGTVTLWGRDGGALGSLGAMDRGAAGPVAWTADGRSLLVLGAGPFLRVWDVEAKQVRRQVRIGPVRGEFSPDGALIASPSHSWTLRLWETATGRPLGTSIRLDQGWLVVSEEGCHRGENDKVEKELFYVVQTEEGQQTLSPAEFAAKYHWQNNETRARLDTR